MEDLLSRNAQSLPIQHLQRGDVVLGTVLEVTEREAVVDIGAKAEGIIPQRERKGYSLKKGDQVYVYVLTTQDRHGQTLLSLKRAEAVKAWLDLEEAKQRGDPLTAVVTGHNKGGLQVEVLGLEGFIPFSHASSVPDLTQERAELQSQLDRMRGEKLKVQVIEVDREQNRIILSEAQALAEEERARQRESLAKYQVGDVVTVPVLAVMPYGLLVELSGVEGLIPQEELSWEEESPEEILARFDVGDKISAKITQLDPEAGKLRLSIKQVSGNPWERFVKEHHAGEELTGEVNRLTSYGVFVTLTEGVEGMLPLSKIPTERKLQVGDEIKVRIVELDVARRRLELELS